MTDHPWELVEYPNPVHACVKPSAEKFPVGTVIRCTVCGKEYFLARDPFMPLSPNRTFTRWVRRMSND